MIRIAEQNDLPAIVDIYNQAIDAKFQTGFTERLRVEDRLAWFAEHDARYPLLVFEADGRVVGWFSISPYRSGRAALRYTVEVSYFLDKDHHYKGIGSQLMQAGLNTCRDLGYKTALAIILNKNSTSIKFAEKFDFEKWGYLPGVADFDGVECSHLYYGIKL